MAPTASVIFAKDADMKSVASDRQAIHRYCRACREAGNVLRKIGYRRRQPPVFNLYYWLPRWAEPMVFGKLFSSRSAQIRFGLHARVVGPELLDLAAVIELVTFAEATSRPDDEGRLDIAIVEGSVSTDEQLAHLRHVRSRADTLVTIGACATAGGIQALRNFARVQDFVRIVYANPAMQLITGFEEQELVGKPLLDLIHPDDHGTAVGEVGDLDIAGQR